MHKKYKKIVKKAIKQGYDFDKIVDSQKRQFGHIESKTSSQLFPPIGGHHKRSRSTLNDGSVGIATEELRKKNQQRLNSNINESQESGPSEIKRQMYDSINPQNSNRKYHESSIIEAEDIESADDSMNAPKQKQYLSQRR